jgi:hypothetical protein
MSRRLFPLGLAGLGKSTPAKRLTQLLANDQHRARPPITLAGNGTPAHSRGAPPPANPPASSPPPPPASNGARRNGHLPPHGHSGKIHQREASEAQPEDVVGAYRHVELLKMDERFSAALERAFRLGKENRRSAWATWRDVTRN